MSENVGRYRNGVANDNIAVHHQLTNGKTTTFIGTQCLTYSTNCFQQLTLESWYTNLKQTPLNICQQLPAPKDFSTTVTKPSV